MKFAYYNEFDEKAAAWLRQLIKEGHLPDGEVDERDIREVSADDVAGFVQCHFFAGIGGWPYALRLAGWPDDKPVWTGSCPCQPFSCAGKQLGEKDERHLWPELKRLIEAVKPASVFGEQVASKAGRAWLTGVRAEMEALGYEFGAADLCAAGVGAPHIRQRLFWGGWMADSVSAGRDARRTEPGTGQASGGGSIGGLPDTGKPGLERYSGNGDGSDEPGRVEAQAPGSVAKSGCACRMGEPDGDGPQSGSETPATAGHGNSPVAASCWHDPIWHECSDGKQRRIPLEPAFFPLANGLPARVVRLRGYGNAIVPEVGKVFIEAFKEVIGDS